MLPERGLLRLFSSKKKGFVDSYNRDLLALCDLARNSDDSQQLFQIKNQLLDILNKVVLAEAEGDITKEAFESFAFTWKTVNKAVRDRLQVDLDHMNGTRHRIKSMAIKSKSFTLKTGSGRELRIIPLADNHPYCTQV